MVAIRSSKTQVAKTLRGIDLTGLRVRLVDAENHIVGTLASRLATILQGKDKPIYNPCRDDGDVCVVVNASKVKFSGRKWDKKVYRWHTGYPGGLRERTAKETFARRPEDILWRAVSGMLPKNSFRSKRLRKLLIFTEEHNIQDVDFVRWELPENIAGKINTEIGRKAPQMKKRV